MKFHFIATCKLELSTNGTGSDHEGTSFMLECSKNLDSKKYVDKDGLPNEEATKVLTHCFIHGLIGNIHAAHQAGYRNDAEHLRFAIEELQKLFVETPTIGKGVM